MASTLLTGLKNRPEVKRVLHPGLETDPGTIFGNETLPVLAAYSHSY